MIVSIVTSALWQGGLVVGVTALILRFVPVRDATTRYAAWFVTAVSLAAVPLFSTLVHWHLPIVDAVEHSAGLGRAGFSLTPLAPLQTQSTSIAWVLGAVWIAGTSFALARLAASYARIARLRRTAKRVSQISGIPVLASSELSIPIATGVLSPAILIPQELFALLPSADLECTIEHELAHVRRRDVATNLVERLLEAAFFWNPWIHVVGRRLAADREAACDDWAVQRLGEPSAYANCLAALGRHLRSSGAPLFTPSAFGSRHSLVARIERLMADRSPNETKLNYVAVGGISVLLAIVTLALQSLVPAPVYAETLAANPVTTIAAACKNPNAEPAALNPAVPDLPKSQMPPRAVTSIVIVNIAADGKPTGARVYRSSGYANVDRAVVTAAEHSTYSPKLVNCVPTQSTYLFRANLAP